MSAFTELQPELYFSYSQFMVYDQSVDLPGCDWTEKHSAQGFARRESAVNFNTPLEFGHAKVTFILGTYQPSDRYARVIGVPFLVTSGMIIIDGPEEINIERKLPLPSKNYWLVAAQQVLDDDRVRIDLFFEPVDRAVKSSRIIVADALLSPELPLLEFAEVAEI